jgi:hypothetical protein
LFKSEESTNSFTGRGKPAEEEEEEEEDGGWRFSSLEYQFFVGKLNNSRLRVLVVLGEGAEGLPTGF